MKNNSQVPWWQPALILFIELSGWIVVPVIAAMFIGKWLDGKYDTSPWIYISSVGVAFIVSIIGITREAMKYSRQIEKNSKKEDKKDNINERTD